MSQNPGLAAIAGLAGAGVNDSIATEVQILTSPSVLRPVFDAVKARKPPEEAKACAKHQISHYRQEEKGTSVLNVEYRDTDKRLVPPITEMISKAYQGYSNRGRTLRSTMWSPISRSRSTDQTPGEGQFPRRPRIRLLQRPRPSRWVSSPATLPAPVSKDGATVGPWWQATAA